jgi:cytochrome b pre-mRNA-processing protein 3
MTFLSFFRRLVADRPQIVALYGSIVAQARQPAFYGALGVPDTLDGRFDMIVVHATLVMRRLRSVNATPYDVAQELLNYLFKDMDRSLREVGVGDMSIGKHVKKMAKAFYGRAEEYEKGLDGSATALNDALIQNVYRKAAPTPDQLAALSRYLLAADQSLRGAADADVLDARLPWTTVGA